MIDTEPDRREEITARAEDLKSARHRLRLTQEALARELDVSLTTVARYERGRQAIPRLVELAVLYLESRPPRHT